MGFLHISSWCILDKLVGLLIQFEDLRQLRMKTQAKENVLWETSTESVMEVGQWLLVGKGCMKQEATVSNGGQLRHRARPWNCSFFHGL